MRFCKPTGWLSGLMCLLLAACSDGTDSTREFGFSELYAQGITRYLGDFSPMLSEPDGAVVNHFFGLGDGPVCLEGDAYSMATRDVGSGNLVVFLEGGGSCWSELCIAIPLAFTGIPAAGILDTADAGNPMNDWNQVYVPACDGSAHAGDTETDTDGDGLVDRHQRGLRNLSAALDVAASTFPNPERIVLAGHSVGAFGTTFGLPLVRYLYPDVPIDILNDSGTGVLRDGAPEFLQTLLEEWNMQAFVPESCVDCLADDGHLTRYMLWQMEQDEGFRRSLVSYKQDAVLANDFLQVGGPAFEASTLREMERQESAFPGRVRSFLVNGNGHTLLLLEPDKQVEDVSLIQWVEFMLDDSVEWQSLSE
jgi:Pectinacetylesterase